MFLLRSGVSLLKIKNEKNWFKNVIIFVAYKMVIVIVKIMFQNLGIKRRCFY